MIYGWGTKIKKTQFIGKYFCMTCRGFTNYYVVQEIFRITIFFIPVFWYTKHHYIMCDNCQRGKEIAKEEADKLCHEKVNMYPAMKIDTIIDDIVTILNQETVYDPNQILNQIKAKHQLHFELPYFEDLIAILCELKKEKKNGI